MKQGRTLVDLATEIQRQANAKADFVADTRRLSFVANGHGPRFSIEGHGYYDITDHAHRQVGERVGIPAKYYDRMLADAPELLMANVNHWFEHKPEQRMVRTLDGRARAFLSDRYRPLDHYDLAEVVLPALSDVGAEVQSCEITETKMYIKGVVSSRTVTVPPPSNGRGYGSGYSHEVAIAPGIVISNSEVGLGALAIQPAVHFLACTNMAVWARHALRKYHVGRNLADGSEEVWRFLSDQTRSLTDAALWSQVRDLAVGALQGDVFEAIVNDLREARGELIIDVTPTVERLAERKGLAVHEQAGVLNHLIQGGDLSKFGLSNAVTRFSQDVESYDRASQLEILGGEVIALPKSEWAVIAA